MTKNIILSSIFLLAIPLLWTLVLILALFPEFLASITFSDTFILFIIFIIHVIFPIIALFLIRKERKRIDAVFGKITNSPLVSWLYTACIVGIIFGVLVTFSAFISAGIGGP